MEYTILKEIYDKYMKGDDYLGTNLEPLEHQTEEKWVSGNGHSIGEGKEVAYTSLNVSDKMNDSPADIEEIVAEIFVRLVDQMIAAECTVEGHKTAEYKLWEDRINDICERALEMVNDSLCRCKESDARIYSCTDEIEPPKIFWKYYDLYRRKRISLSEYASVTSLTDSALQCYLKNIAKKIPKAIEEPKQI